MGRILIFFLLVFVGAGADVFAQEMPGAKERWRHYRSPHFDLYSSGDDSSSREILEQMEVARVIFSNELQLIERSRTPVTLFFFGNESSYEAYLPDHLRNGRFVGMYSPSLDGSRILLSPEINPESLQGVAFHEYVHHMVQSSNQTLPLWLEEGVAELFSAMKLTKKSVEFGRPLQGRLMELSRSELIPLESLFMADSRSSVYNSKSHTGVFYAQSWALVHYWLYGKNNLPKGSGGNFMQWVEGNPYATADETRTKFESVFGMDYSSMLEELKIYIDRGSYGWSTRPRPSLPSPKTYTRRDVPKKEINLRLAVLGVNSSKSAIGNYALVLEVSQGPTDAEIYETLGSQAMIDDQRQKAREMWEKAIELGSRNPAVLRQLTRLQLYDWIDHFDPSLVMPREVRETLLARVRKNIAEAPDETWAYEALVWLQAYSSHPDWKELIALVSPRLKYLEEPDRALLGVAVAAWKLGNGEEVSQLAKHARRYDPSMWTQYGFEVLMAKVENRSTDFSQMRQSRRESRPPGLLD